MNYNRAYFLYSLYFASEEERIKYLKRSSRENYAKASYELALIYYSAGNYELAQSYLLKAEQQNLAIKQVDRTLHQSIQMLKILL